MVRYQNILKMVLAGLIVAPAFTACSDSNDLTGLGELETEEQTFGKATGNFTAEEWFPGGELGTTEKASYSAPTPAVENIAGMEEDFNTGNDLFEHLYTFEQAPRRGLGLPGCATVVLPAIRVTDTVGDRLSIVPTPSATAICWSSITPATMPISLR